MDSGMFNIFPFMFMLVFLFILGTIIFNVIRGVRTWSYNNSQPVLTVWAKVVTKRTNVSHHTHNNNNNVAHHSTSTTYYVTFEVESGSRMELRVDSGEYGMLVEGDAGKLTFQGSRYQGFSREM